MTLPELSKHHSSLSSPSGLQTILSQHWSSLSKKLYSFSVDREHRHMRRFIPIGGGMKSIFVSSVLVCFVGWFSILHTLQRSTSNCTVPPHAVQHLPSSNWKVKDNIDSPARQLADDSSQHAVGLSAHLTREERGQASLQQQQIQELQQEIQKLHAREQQLLAVPPAQPSPPQKPKKRLRVLMGIFTFDAALQRPYRRQFRKLFEVFPKYNDTRVCSLHDFENAPTDELRYQCQLIYTFVVAGNKNPNAPTELVDDSAPILIKKPDPSQIRAGDLRSISRILPISILKRI
jgi:hypothetical protein